MTTLKQCDKCKKLENPMMIDGGIWNILFRKPFVLFPYGDIHLCRECIDEFFKFITPKK